MYGREWREILDAIHDLDSENIIDTIKDKLYAKYRNVYEEWKGEGFNVNHLFLFLNGYMGGKCTLLHIAASHGAVTVVKALLKNGANVNAIDEDHITPLHCAAGNGHVDVVKILLQQRGIKVNAVDVDGETPLHWAARFGREDVAEVLLKKGAKINSIDREKATPLHLAARFNYKNVIKFLLQKGADPLLRDDHNRMPKDLVWDEEIQQLFDDDAERRFLESNIIKASMTISFIVAVLEIVLTVWCRGEGYIGNNSIPVVLAAVIMIAVMTGIGIYMKLNRLLYTEPSTEIDRAQAEREEERIHEL